MIDLKTCTRSDFVEAYQNLEGLLKHLESENRHLNERLQEYEGIQTDDDKEKEFQKWLAITENSINEKQTRKLWERMSKKKKKKAFKNYPLYKKEQPDKKYRVTNDKYLRHEKYNDIIKVAKEFKRPKSGANAYFVQPATTTSTVDISARIKQCK